MAVGLDLLIVSLEIAMVVTIGTKSSKPVAKFANPAVIVAFAWSAGLNGLRFSAGSGSLPMAIAAAALGVSIPALIFAGTRSWAAMAMSSRTA
jgi:hypothetical protein